MFLALALGWQFQATWQLQKRANLASSKPTKIWGK